MVSIPCIGLVCDEDFYRGRVRLRRAYLAAVEQAGGLPVLLPATTDTELAGAYLDKIEALVLTGGGDLDPAFFGEEPLPGLGEVVPLRDAFEIALVKLAWRQGKPILAICRGLQVLNVAAGGDLYQDLERQYAGALQHVQKGPRSYPTHEVKILPGSLLFRLTGKDNLRVNSLHHQAVRRVGVGLKVAAYASDGVIEALEGEGNFILAVQWHPEDLLAFREHRILFEALVKAAGR
ncbi:MAG: putative glutamine amidotransferase [Clostridia bacterium]|nr:putative glutamine amidotransferase [Clostridia bacterium]